MGCVIAGQKFIETQFNTTGQKQENFNFACSIQLKVLEYPRN